MKYTYIVIAACMTARFAHAQISFSSSDMPAAGFRLKVGVDTIIGAQNWGNQGANQVYTFTNFQRMYDDTVEYRSLTAAQQSYFTNGNIAVTTDGQNFLISRNTATKWSYEGAEGYLNGNMIRTKFNPVSDQYVYPVQYLGKFSGTTGTRTTLSGAAVGQPSVDSVRLTTTTQYSDTIDGWGKVTTPVGSYKCLREKRKETTNTIIEIKLALPFAQWTVFSNTTATTVRYYYLTKEAKGSVITFEYDTNNTPIKATWALVPPSAPIAEFSKSTPVAGSVSFTDSSDGYPDTYSWNFGDGSPNSSAQNPTHVYTANGTYIVCLTVTNAGGSSTHCESVTISGLTTGNAKPVAADDTATMTQPGQVTINLTANDIDPDADSLCISHAWGAPPGWISYQGCSSIIYNPTDTTFRGYDTLFYRVCDKDPTPQCDTAMVVVRVRLLPRASFVANGSLFDNCSVGANRSAYATYTLSNTSLYHDSIIWQARYIQSFGINSTCIDSVAYAHGGNTLLLVPAGLILNGKSKCADLAAKYNTMSVCVTALNSDGNNTYCDTTCHLQWNTDLSEIPFGDLRIAPNPATDLVEISLGELGTYDHLDIREFIITDALGRTLKTIVYQPQPTQLLVTTDLPNGTYFLLLQNALGQTKTGGRLVVAR